MIHVLGNRGILIDSYEKCSRIASGIDRWQFSQLHAKDSSPKLVKAISSSPHAQIRIIADQRVDATTFAELFYTRCKNDEISAIVKRQTRAVDSFVAQPGALILVRVQINDRFANWAVERT